MTRLQKLDVIVFWSARFFAGALILYMVRSGWIVGSAIDESYSKMHHWHPLLTSTIMDELFAVTIIALICLSLYFFRKIISRLYLFVIGALFFLGGTLSTLSWDGIAWKLTVISAAIGFASLMWTAIRPEYQNLAVTGKC
jgi:hypothetical protein